jgi:hypothetical protein
MGDSFPILSISSIITGSPEYFEEQVASRVTLLAVRLLLVPFWLTL